MFKKGHKHNKNWYKKVTGNKWNVGKKLPETHKNNIGLAHIGMKHYELSDKRKQENYRSKLKRRLLTPYSKRKHWRIKSKYGISFEQFEQMKVAQDNRCAVCGEKFKGTPAIDHNHATGQVRQLLCSKCNSGLGLFGDNVYTLDKAIGYLNKWNAV